MNAIDAYNHIDTQKWANTSIPERLHLMEEIRANIKDHFNDLGASDRKMKNNLIGEEMFSMSEAILNTVVPVANTVTACIHLYESLLKEEMLSPIAVNKIDE